MARPGAARPPFFASQTALCSLSQAAVVAAALLSLVEMRVHRTVVVLPEITPFPRLECSLRRMGKGARRREVAHAARRDLKLSLARMAWVAARSFCRATVGTARLVRVARMQGFLRRSASLVVESAFQTRVVGVVVGGDFMEVGGVRRILLLLRRAGRPTGVEEEAAADLHSLIIPRVSPSFHHSDSPVVEASCRRRPHHS